MSPWDGNDRRAPSSPELQNVRQELEAVRESLLQVAFGMEQFVSSDQLDKRIEHERKQQRRLFAALGLAALIGLASLGVNAFQLSDLHKRSVRNRIANKEAQVVTISAVNCILYSLNSHRLANEYAHGEIAKDLGKPLQEPFELQPVPQPELATACDTLRKYLSGGAP